MASSPRSSYSRAIIEADEAERNDKEGISWMNSNFYF
jgi:hypothetical protein